MGDLTFTIHSWRITSNNYLKIYVKFDFRFHTVNQGKSQKCFFLVCRALRLFVDLSPYDQYIQDSHYLAWDGIQNSTPRYFLLLTNRKKIHLSMSFLLWWFNHITAFTWIVFLIKFLNHPSFSSISSVTSIKWITPLRQKTNYILMVSKFTWLAQVFYWA